MPRTSILSPVATKREALHDLGSGRQTIPVSDLRSEPASPKAFWDDRLSSTGPFRGPGTSGYSEAYNRALYRFNARVMDILLGPLPIDWRNARVLDVGSGRGFWLEYLIRKGADVDGVELTDFGFARLSEQYPQVHMYRGDVADPTVLPPAARYDLITAISVFIHIVEDGALASALGILSSHLRTGGYLVFNEKYPATSVTAGGYCRNRSRADWASLLQAAGLTPVREIPSHVLMAGNRTLDLLGNVLPGILLFGDELLLRISDNTGVLSQSRLRSMVEPRSTFVAARKG